MHMGTVPILRPPPRTRNPKPYTVTPELRPAFSEFLSGRLLLLNAQRQKSL